MKKNKSSSYNSTPFSAKENICPNSKFNTLNYQNKRHQTPSIGTDSQFSIFKTINVARPSHPSITTKSRADMQAIIQDFSNNHQNSTKQCPYSHKSFLALLGIAIGKDEFSMEEAIQKCQEYEISGRDQLLNILQSKQPTRQWPLPLSSMLLTDLGQLKIMQICKRLQNEQDLLQQQIEILQFLLPKIDYLQTIDKNIVLDYYHQFRNKIDQKFNLVDFLVKQYTLRIQPKIRKIYDKIILIKIQKRFRKYEKLNKKYINYIEMKSCLEGLNLNQQEILILFKYIYFIQNDKLMQLVDRKSLVQINTCIKQILNKNQLPFTKQTISRIQFIDTENNQVINDLLTDKTHLLQQIDSKDEQIIKLNNSITLLKLKLQNQVQQSIKERQRQIDSLKIKYINRIKILQGQNKQKDNIIQWYKNQLQAAIQANSTQIILHQRNKIFQNTYHRSKNNTIRNEDKENNQVKYIDHIQCFKD